MVFASRAFYNWLMVNYSLNSAMHMSIINEYVLVAQLIQKSTFIVFA